MKNTKTNFEKREKLKEIALIAFGAALILLIFLFSYGRIIFGKANVPALPQEVCSRYTQLNENEREIYTSLIHPVEEGRLYCRLKTGQKYTNAEKERAICAFAYDHPEFFWLVEGGYGYRSFGEEKTVFKSVLLRCYEYWEYKADLQIYSDALQSRVDEICREAESFSTDYEKALFVHDYIIQNTEYDYEAAEENDKTNPNPECMVSSCAYGCLVNGKAVCAGYAKAYQLVMCSLGIECVYVTGDTPPGLHAWNRIKLDGEWYYIDVTWDDAGSNGLRYDYFCITTAQISKDHTADESLFKEPLATSTKYNNNKKLHSSRESHSVAA